MIRRMGLIVRSAAAAAGTDDCRALSHTPTARSRPHPVHHSPARAASVAALALAAVATTAAIEPAAADAYRDELLVADASAITVAVIGRDRSYFGYVGGVGLWLGSPAVHLAHGNVGRAAGALALRGGSVLATYGMLMWCLDDGDEGGKIAGCVLGSLAAGSVLVAGAVAIDYAVLARDDAADSMPAQLTWGGVF
jgi:hypothetical protein